MQELKKNTGVQKFILRKVKISFILLTLIFCQCCFAQHWQSLLGGLQATTSKLYADSVSNKLYVGGVFKWVDHHTQWGIASWNGNQWGNLTSGIDDSSFTASLPASTYAMIRYGNYLYVGGAFYEAGHLNTPAFARWDGTSWDSVPGAHMKQSDLVRDAVVYNNEVYICGAFDSVENVPANCIAKWNGITWQTVANNYNFLLQGVEVLKMQFYHGELFVSGFFADPSGTPCYLASWNGSSWHFYTTGLAASGQVYDMKVYNNKLYVAGLFYTPTDGYSIISWNDTTWSGVGGGAQTLLNGNPTINEMCVHNGKLYCVGNFHEIGGVLAGGLASWDGTNWCGYNTDFERFGQFQGAFNIEFYNDTMYVGGGFQTADGDTVNYITKWIGGNYVDTCGFISTGVNELPQQNFSVKVFPNPFSTIATFQMTGLDGNKTLIIYDQLGKEIWRKETTENQIEFATENFSAGLYFYRIELNGEIKFNGKLIID